MEEVRRIEESLHPLILHELGILAAISWFCRNFRDLHPDIHVETRLPIEESDIPRRLGITMFRIMQQAFNSAAENSETRAITLSLAKEGNGIHLSVTHDSHLSEEMEVGITAMRERTRTTGGEFYLHSSSSGRALTIEAVWPCNQPKDDDQTAADPARSSSADDA
jgi:signal transduction histidine kinase